MYQRFHPPGSHGWLGAGAAQLLKRVLCCMLLAWKNIKFKVSQVQFLLNTYCFHTIIKLKKLGQIIMSQGLYRFPALYHPHYFSSWSHFISCLRLSMPKHAITSLTSLLTSYISPFILYLLLPAPQTVYLKYKIMCLFAPSFQQFSIVLEIIDNYHNHWPEFLYEMTLGCLSELITCIHFIVAKLPFPLFLAFFLFLQIYNQNLFPHAHPDFL